MKKSHARGTRQRLSSHSPRMRVALSQRSQHPRLSVIQSPKMQSSVPTAANSTRPHASEECPLDISTDAGTRGNPALSVHDALAITPSPLSLQSADASCPVLA